MMSWLLAALLVPNSWAGDPCPIGLDFHEYTPSWRDRAADLQALSTKRPWYGLHYGAQKGQAVVFLPSPPRRRPPDRRRDHGLPGHTHP